MQHYEGDFKNDYFHGNGILSNSEEIYEGDFFEGEKSGKGKTFHKKGEIYIGEMKNDMRNGKGILYKKNGEFFEGNFENGIKKGEGTLIYSNGCKLFGLWDDDFHRFEGKFYGNVENRREYNFCKINEDSLIEKSETFFDNNFFKGSNLELIEVEFEGKKYEILLNKIM
jgi:hypothetical protein